MSVTPTTKMTIDISWQTLAKVVLVVGSIFFLFFIRDILLLIFVALILASAFDPWVDALQKYRIPRSLGILLIYLGVLLVMGGAVYLIIPPIVNEMNQLAKDFPTYWGKVTENFQSFQNFSQEHGWAGNINDSLQNWQSNIGVGVGGVFNTVYSFFGGLISFFMILVITFYMTVDEHGMKRVLRSLIPVKYQPYSTHLINRMQEKIGRWLRGQLLLSLIIFLMSYAGLTILGVRYALVLALFAGVTELIPYIGPFIGLVPALFIALTQSPLIALGVLVLYVIIQQLENYVIVPKVMQRAVGLNPIVIIVAMLVGAKMAGVLGIILAVPVATALSVAVGDLFELKRDEDEIVSEDGL
jgi:sporulation integral membrane protein YtvI